MVPGKWDHLLRIQKLQKLSRCSLISSFTFPWLDRMAIFMAVFGKKSLFIKIKSYEVKQIWCLPYRDIISRQWLTSPTLEFSGLNGWDTHDLPFSWSSTSSRSLLLRGVCGAPDTISRCFFSSSRPAMGAVSDIVAVYRCLVGRGDWITTGLAYHITLSRLVACKWRDTSYLKSRMEVVDDGEKREGEGEGGLSTCPS